MKKLLFSLAALSAWATLHAEPLNQKILPAATQWVLHLDAEAFRNTRIGAAFVEEKLEPQVRKTKTDSNLDLSFSFKKVTALTAFGGKVGNQDDGVLVLQTTADIRGDLEKLIGFKEKNGNGEPPISRVSVNGTEFYTIGGDLNAVAASSNLWLLGKSKTSLQAARDVALAKSPSLQKTNFFNYPAVADSFFFLAVAETASAGDSLPAQARILQNADGGRIALSEKGEKLVLNLALRSKDLETASQIRNVLQGLVGFVALTQAENKDLVALANSASVSSTEKLVSVNLSFPLDRAMQKMREEK